MTATGSSPVPLAERHLLGALLALPAERAAAVCKRVRRDDLAEPKLRVVLDLIGAVAARGVDPDVAMVHGEARTTGAVPATRINEVGVLLVDLLGDCPHATAVDLYAGHVLEESWRRSVRAAAVRLTQAVDNDNLADVVAAWRRSEAVVTETARRMAVSL